MRTDEKRGRRDGGVALADEFLRSQRRRPRGNRTLAARSVDAPTSGLIGVSNSGSSIRLRENSILTMRLPLSMSRTAGVSAAYAMKCEARPPWLKGRAAGLRTVEADALVTKIRQILTPHRTCATTRLSSTAYLSQHRKRAAVAHLDDLAAQRQGPWQQLDLVSLSVEASTHKRHEQRDLSAEQETREQDRRGHACGLRVRVRESLRVDRDRSAHSLRASQLEARETTRHTRSAKHRLAIDMLGSHSWIGAA